MVTREGKKTEICSTKMRIDISAEIKGVEYKPFLCKELDIFTENDIDTALHKEASFIWEINGNQLAVSWWVSPKRTRSYPYARVYDTLGFIGRKVTIIPVLKDEGQDGDRDFLQWDTISLMSLLGIYVIISYYSNASVNPKFKNKITGQRFDVDHINNEVKKLLYYQSDPLHWNLTQLDNIHEITKIALEKYKTISQRLKVKMHSFDAVEKRINKILKEKEYFMKYSRELAMKAQRRESMTTQPKEFLNGTKATLTIRNYLGGLYYFTCDEVRVLGRDIYLIEGKHSSNEKILPSIEDIKDGLLKMVLLTNLKDVKIGGERYNPVPVLKLTTVGVGVEGVRRSVRDAKPELIDLLIKEAKTNGFRLMINDEFLA